MIRSSSLLSRLVLTVSAIVLLAFGAGAWIVHRSAASAFREVQRDVQVGPGRGREATTVADGLEGAYKQGGWESVREHASASRPGRPPFLVLDPSNEVSAVTDSRWQRATVRPASDGGLIVSMKLAQGDRVSVQELATTAARDLRNASGEVWGRLVLLPEDHAEPPEAGRAFASRFWRTAAISLGGVLLAAVAAIVWVMRRSLAPIDELTLAARDLQRGKTPAPLRRQGAAEFRELLDAYNSAAESIARTEQLRRDLISDIAHELRTPLTNLRGQVEALQQGLVRGDRDFGVTLHSELKQLERLVSDVHQLALSDAGQLRVQLQPLPLRETVEQLTAPLVSAAAGTLSVSGSPEVWCLADEERLRQVLNNLVENAERHRPVGLEIRIAVTGEDGQASFVLQDNGPGVDEADRPHIFDRFYRAEKSRNRATGGAGLGLAIVQGLLRAMNGTIRYEATAGAGATFVITLPAAPPRHI